MRLVIDADWDVCYIEITPEEHAILRTEQELWRARVAHIPQLLKGTWTPPPEDDRLDKLKAEIFELAQKARPFHNKIHRETWPELTLYGIEARLAS